MWDMGDCGYKMWDMGDCGYKMWDMGDYRYKMWDMGYWMTQLIEKVKTLESPPPIIPSPALFHSLTYYQ